jgi:hypothetical protein
LYKVGEGGRNVKRKDATEVPVDTALFGRLEKPGYDGRCWF